jgi:hypothetical protein
MIRIIYNEPLDYTLSYKIFRFGKQNEKYRYQFLESMVKKGLYLVMEGEGKKRDVFVCCPFDRLLEEAQEMKLRMPLTEATISR